MYTPDYAAALPDHFSPMPMSEAREEAVELFLLIELLDVEDMGV